MRAHAAFLAFLLFGCEADISILEKPVQVPEQEETDLPVEEGSPEIQVEPSSLAFGEVESGDLGTATVVVTNVGDAPLTITGIVLQGDPAFTSPDEGLNATIQPGDSREVEVLFVAGTTDAAGGLKVLSDDADEPEVRIPMDAVATLRQIYGDAIDFGFVHVGQWSTLPLRVHNDGNKPVVLSEVRSSDPHFTPYLAAPVTIRPGTITDVDVTFAPDDLIAFNGVLRMTADTPVAPDPVPVQGSGAEGPVAICSADPRNVMAITESFRFKGDQSYDPAGRPLTASWTWVSVPPGSTVGNPLRGMNTGLVTPDVIGDYVARLVVTNDLGYSSAPCTATSTASAGSDLWVEMFWQYRGDDMDLHLLKGNGAIRTANDCYYANCVGGLSWGAAGRSDDPRLDLDDIPNRGPENINISTPGANTYTVLVHDYTGSVYNGANQVTVSVYISGVLQFQDTRTITGEGREERFALIDWNVQPPTVTPL